MSNNIIKDFLIIGTLIVLLGNGIFFYTTRDDGWLVGMGFFLVIIGVVGFKKMDINSFYFFLKRSKIT